MVVKVPGWSMMNTTLYCLVQKHADSGFEGNVHVAPKPNHGTNLHPLHVLPLVAILAVINHSLRLHLFGVDTTA